MTTSDTPMEPVHLIEDEPSGDKFLVYGTDEGVRVELKYQGETLWMTQAQIAELFGVDARTVSEHLNNIYRDGELVEGATVRKFRTVRIEGGRDVSRELNHYNLDAVISVGYRVSSKRGTLFRTWATGVLVQLATKGFVVDARRLKNPEEHDRVAELREIVRDIRASESNLYAELRRICSLCQDYDPKAPPAHEFYARMQAKLFWAVVNRTPSMILTERANATLPNMGLQTWPKSEIRKQDALIAKNYLSQNEIRELNRLTDILLSIFEDQLAIGKLTLMAEASTLLDSQLKNLARAVLRHGGAVAHQQAEEHAKAEYLKFDRFRREFRKLEADKELAELRRTTQALPKK
jgi:hypothetical protein